MRQPPPTASPRLYDGVLPGLIERGIATYVAATDSDPRRTDHRPGRTDCHRRSNASAREAAALLSELGSHVKRLVRSLAEQEAVRRAEIVAQDLAA